MTPQVIATSARWFFLVDKQKTGPVSFAKLKEFVAIGKLKPSDMVMQENGTQWQPLKGVPGLLPEISATPKPPPPPPEPSVKDTLKGLTKEKHFRMLVGGVVVVLAVVLLYTVGSLVWRLIPSSKTDPAAFGFSRSRPPSKSFQVKKQQKGNGNELTVDLGEMLKISTHKCRCSFLYFYSGNKSQNPVDWKTLDIVFQMEGPGSAVNDSATANLFTRGKIGEAIEGTPQYDPNVGYGYYWHGGYWWHHNHAGTLTNQNKVDCAITIDGKEYIKQAVFRSKEHPADTTFVTVSTSLFDETTVKNIYHAKSVSIRLASADSPIRFELSGEALAAFCDLVDQVFKGK